MKYVVIKYIDDKLGLGFRVINLKANKAHSFWRSSREALKVARDLNNVTKE